jgi:sugar phosphate isomerase/epimerase
VTVASRPVRSGLCSISLRAYTAEAVIDTAARAGLAGIEWGGDVHVPPGDTTRASAVARRSADAGIACPSYGSYLYGGRSTAPEAAAVLDAAEALDVPNVRIWAEVGVGLDASADDRARVVDGVRMLAEAVTARGLSASLEYHVDTQTHTAASTLALLDEVNVSGLFTYWQPDWTLAPDVLRQELRAVRDRLSHVHVFCWKSYRDRLPLAEGEPVLPGVLGELGELAATGSWAEPRYAFIEHVIDDDPERVVADAATLHGWLSGRDSTGTVHDN